MADGASQGEEAVFQRIKEYLTVSFEVPADRITYDACLFDDLDLDSIDGVDLMVRLQEETGRKVSASQFEDVRTVRDLVALVRALQSGK